MNEEPMLAEPNLSPQSVVDSASIANCAMTKNKESLKLKLMLRRPIDVLVDQGILPPPKSSPAFYEQKLKLERAKTGDYLKHKIQRRPQRDELVQQHILEQEVFDPSYYEQERKLKRARLADDLNERLSHRPGPLELIKGNILHTDEFLEQAIKDGQITFKKTCEGEIIKNPPKRFVFEEESSSDSAPSPSLQNQNQCNISNINLNVSTPSFIVANSGNLVSIPGPIEQPAVIPTAANVINANLSYIVTTPVNNVLQPSPSTVFITTNNNTNTSTNSCLQGSSATSISNNNSIICHNKPIDSFNFGPTKSIQNAQSQKTKKKIKSKTIPKARVIKFHEYTGPPSARKQSNSNQTCSETSYELLLKQQQLFLQWQLESQQNCSSQKISKQNENSPKSPKNEIPDFSSTLNSEDRKNVNENKAYNNNVNKNDFGVKNSATKSSINQEEPRKQAIECFEKTNSELGFNQNVKNTNMPSVKKIISKLEDMKVSDLKAELKKRNLPVSGAKQQLIERLKPFSESVVINNNTLLTSELNGSLSNYNNKKCSNSNDNQYIYQDACVNNLNTIKNPQTTTAIILNSGGQNFLTNNEMINTNKKLNEDFVLLTNANNENFSTIPVHLKQTNQIALEGTTLTIPIGNTFIPQYQVVSSTSNDNNIRLNGLNIAPSNSIQPLQLPNNILISNNKLHDMGHTQPNLNSTATSLNYTPTINQLNEITPSNLTILTSRIPMTQLDDRMSLNFGTAILPNNKLVGISNSGAVFHQLLLYPPNTINTNQEINNSLSMPKHHRSNSLPSETLHPLQRNTSLPLIINQMPISQFSIDSNFKLIKVGENISTHAQETNDVSPNNKQDMQSLNVQNVLNTSETNIIGEMNNFKMFSMEKKEKIPKNSPESKSINLLETHTSKVATPLTTSTTFSSMDNQCFKEDNSFVESSNNNNIQQPDSTTNNTNLDFDFVLNFDDLNAFEDDINKTSTDELSCQNMNSTTKNKHLIKNDEMIDFNDNWLEFSFVDNSTYLQESDMIIDNSNNKTRLENVDRKTMIRNNYNALDSDNSLLETINQLFDTSNLEENDNGNFKIDSSTKNDCQINNVHSDQSNSFSTFNSSNDIFMNNNLNPSGSTSTQYSSFDSNQSSAPNCNFFTNNHSSVNIDSFSDLFFEDNDFKNSVDFPILLDKIDFAT